MLPGIHLGQYRLTQVPGILSNYYMLAYVSNYYMLAHVSNYYMLAHV